jgi:hypothetical protein
VVVNELNENLPLEKFTRVGVFSVSFQVGVKEGTPRPFLAATTKIGRRRLTTNAPLVVTANTGAKLESAMEGSFAAMGVPARIRSIPAPQN